MLNCRWSKFRPIFVLILGLVSCTRPQAPEDSLKVPEPVWELTNGTSIPFRQASSSLASHDLGDHLSMKLSPSAALKVSSRCLWNNQVFTDSVLLQVPAVIALFSLLPHNMLLAPVIQPASPPLCSLDFLAVNTNGSTDHFQMPETKIVSLDRDIGWVAPSDQRAFALGSHSHFQLQNNVDESHLLCERGETPALKPAGKVIDLDDFDLTDLEKPSDPSVQKCQLLGIHSGVVVALSFAFDLSLRTDWPDISYTVTRGSIDHNDPLSLPLFTFRMTNPHAEPLKIRLQKPAASDFSAYVLLAPLESQMSCRPETKLNTVEASLKLEASSFVQTEESFDFFDVNLPAKTFLMGSVSITVAPALHGMVFFPAAYVVDEIRPLVMGESADQQSWGMPQMALLSASDPLPKTLQVSCDGR